MNDLEQNVLFFLAMYDDTDEGGPVRGWSVGQLARQHETTESDMVGALQSLRNGQEASCVYARKGRWFTTAYGRDTILELWQDRRRNPHKTQNAKRWIADVRAGIDEMGNETTVENAVIPEKLSSPCCHGDEWGLEDAIDWKNRIKRKDDQWRAKRRKK